jgi:hypothetical protein
VATAQPWFCARELLGDVLVDARFLFDKAAVLGDIVKGRPCFIFWALSWSQA